jgi:4a-hydroxytetrahydrobiopterin dehydratase
MTMTESNVFTPEQVGVRLQGSLPGWTLQDGQLCRTFRTADFRTALLLTSVIGHLAEVAWHHPEITLGWGKVEVRLMSHDVGGITERDFALANEIERMADWRPDKHSGLSGTPDEDRWRYLVRD